MYYYYSRYCVTFKLLKYCYNRVIKTSNKNVEQLKKIYKTEYAYLVRGFVKLLTHSSATMLVTTCNVTVIRLLPTTTLNRTQCSVKL